MEHVIARTRCTTLFICLSFCRNQSDRGPGIDNLLLTHIHYCPNSTVHHESPKLKYESCPCGSKLCFVCCQQGLPHVVTHKLSSCVNILYAYTHSTFKSIDCTHFNQKQSVMQHVFLTLHWHQKCDSMVKVTFRGS